MTAQTLYPAERGNLRLSFEYFPPKTDEMEAQLFQTAEDLSVFGPAFVTVTYGAGGSTKARSLTTVRRMIEEMGFANTAAHLTCVGAPKAEVDAVIDEYIDYGVRHFVALRGDPQGGIGSTYQPHPDGYASSSTAFWVTFSKVMDLALVVCICNCILIPKLLYKKSTCFLRHSNYLQKIPMLSHI